MPFIPHAPFILQAYTSTMNTELMILMFLHNCSLRGKNYMTLSSLSMTFLDLWYFPEIFRPGKYFCSNKTTFK